MNSAKDSHLLSCTDISVTSILYLQNMSVFISIKRKRIGLTQNPVSFQQKVAFIHEYIKNTEGNPSNASDAFQIKVYL